MPQTSQFGTSNIVAEFQGFFSGGVLTVRAAQNCVAQRIGGGLSGGGGGLQLLLSNVVPDDCNFLPQVHQFVVNGTQLGYPVVCSFPPVGAGSAGLLPTPTLNYINFQFYIPGGGSTPADPNAYSLLNIVVFSCNDGLVGLTNPAGGVFRTPGNP